MISFVIEDVIMEELLRSSIEVVPGSVVELTSLFVEDVNTGARCDNRLIMFTNGYIF